MQEITGDQRTILRDGITVDANRTALDELTNLAVAGCEPEGSQGGTDGRRLRPQQVPPRHRFRSKILRDRLQGRSVQTPDFTAEKGRRRRPRGVDRFGAVHHGRDLVGETPLGRSFLRAFDVREGQGFDLVAAEEGEPLQEIDHVLVGRVQPELVESVGTGPVRREPDRPGLGLSELAPVRLGDQRRSEPEGLDPVPIVLPLQPAGEIDARDDVPVLVASLLVA